MLFVVLCHGAKGHQKYCECRVANKVNVGVASVDACRSLLHHYPNVWGVVRPRNAGTIDRFVHCHPLSTDTLRRNCRHDFIFQLHWMESSSTRSVGVESRVGSDWPVHVSSGVSVAWGELGSYPLYFVVVFGVNLMLMFFYSSTILFESFHDISPPDESGTFVHFNFCVSVQNINSPTHVFFFVP